MKNLKTILIITLIAIIFLISFYSLTSWIKDTLIKEEVNICGQTMAEANDPVNWHNGIYSPDNCNINK